MLKANDTHKKIIEILRIKGPSLPIQISKQIGLSSLFVSAFLSELAGEKRIKISNLKVGGSPLYFLDGQQEQLEKFYKYLHPKEAEAFLLLKEKGILKDSEQTPAIRVALRSIRDFAMGFKKDDEIFWRYAFVPENRIMELLKKAPEPKKIKEKIKLEAQKAKPAIEIRPLKIQGELKKETKKKQKPKSEFVLKVIQILNSNYKIIEEKDYKTKEYNCIIQINSNLGLINFFTQAKDKKTISEADLRKLLSHAQAISLPALILYTGKISKKSQEFVEKYYSILKTRRI